VAIYGVVIGFLGVLVLGWDNKGEGSMWHKGPLDWLLVLWCFASSALGFYATKTIVLEVIDRPMRRAVASVTVLVNATAFLSVAIDESGGETWLALGMPGILGIVGVAFWHHLSRNHEASPSNQSYMDSPRKSGE
jgi:hypothetical protein